jgi:hypothetical protein
MSMIEKLATENLTVAVFKVHSNKNEAASKKAGRPIYDDMEVCELKFAANKQTVGVFPAHEIFRWLDDPVTGEREPLTYALAYPDQYKRFKAGEAQVASGTPLSELTFIGQGKRLELKAINIHTAEALAVVDGNALKMLGAGGRTLKEQAQAYLDSAAGTADVTALAAENADLRARFAALEAKINGRPATASEDDAEGDDGEGGDAGSGPELEGASPFLIMEAADIVNWLEDATGKKPKKGLSHAALVKLADTVNAELAKKKTVEAA